MTKQPDTTPQTHAARRQQRRRQRHHSAQGQGTPTHRQNRQEQARHSQNTSHQQSRQSGGMQLFSGMWLVMRSFFWTKQWAVWAERHFPEPRDKAIDTFSKWRGICLVLMFVVAYTCYMPRQITPSKIIQSFTAGLSWASIFNNIAFICIMYFVFAALLHVRWHKIVKPLAVIALPLGVMLVWFGLMRYATVTDPRGESNSLQLLWIVSGLGTLCGVFGLGYTVYRGVNCRMGAYDLHPTLGVLMELALSTKALMIIMRGQATILWLPYISSRALSLALPVITVGFFVQHATKVHRQYMRQRGDGFENQILRTWHKITNRDRPFTNRMHILWRFAHGQAFAFCAALVLLAAIVLAFPSGMTSFAIFR